MNDDKTAALFIDAALNAEIVEARLNLAYFTATTFQDVGKALHVSGHILGEDRRDGLSPFGHGNDAAVAMSLLLRIASQLVSGSASMDAPLIASVFDA